MKTKKTIWDSIVPTIIFVLIFGGIILGGIGWIQYNNGKNEAYDELCKYGTQIKDKGGEFCKVNGSIKLMIIECDSSWNVKCKAYFVV